MHPYTQYLKFHAAAVELMGLKFGDKVIVTRAPKTSEFQWPYGIGNYEDLIGKTCKVSWVDNDCALIRARLVPIFCLKKV